MLAPMKVRLAAALCVALAACANSAALEEEVLGAPPAPDTGFLANPVKGAPSSDRAPFDRFWVWQERDWRDHAKLYVAPVDVTHVLEMSLWGKVSVATIDWKSDLARLAVEFHDEVARAFRDDPNHHFEVSDDAGAPGADTAVLELALVQLVPPKAGLGILGVSDWSAPLAIGVPADTATALADQGSVAFELRVRDGRTKTVEAMAADRETGPATAVDARSATWYGNVDVAFRDWSHELVALANTPRDEQARRSAYFTPMPW